MAEATDLTPLEWLARLGDNLIKRQNRIRFWKRYYRGEQDLPTGPSQVADAYRRFQRKARTNLCLLCVESMVHRLNVIGYRDGTGKPQDNLVWQLWQAAKLDARQSTIWRKALSQSAAYVVVGPDPRRSKAPRVTIEGPENVIVETDPADPLRRLAALRLWHDSIAKRWLATLYLPGPGEGQPGTRHRWQSRAEFKTPGGRRLSFAARAWEERGDPERSLADVPVVPFLNGDEGEDPVAEFDVGIDVQDRLNLTVLNRLTADRFAAFRQRGLVNYEPEEDPVTGMAIPPFNPGMTQLWTVPPPEPGDPEAKFVDFAQTDISGMLRGAEADMRAFAATTLTPVYYMPGDLINIGQDAIGALDAGHNAKCRHRMAYWGEGLEEVVQLMATVAELDKDLTAGEVVWARPENFNPAQMADFLSKLVGAQVPLPLAVEEIGWSPQRVEQLRSELAAAALQVAVLAGSPPTNERVPAPAAR